jgi:hypothetical protein
VVSPSVEPKQRRRDNTSGTIVAAALLFDVRTFFEKRGIAACDVPGYLWRRLLTPARMSHPHAARAESTFRPFRSSLYVTMMTVE